MYSIVIIEHTGLFSVHELTNIFTGKQSVCEKSNLATS